MQHTVQHLPSYCVSQTSLIYQLSPSSVSTLTMITYAPSCHAVAKSKDSTARNSLALRGRTSQRERRMVVTGTLPALKFHRLFTYTLYYFFALWLLIEFVACFCLL